MLEELVARSLDASVAALAARQHGVVATRQLVALGITQQAVSLRARAGRLHRLHRGVYAVGHTVLTVRGHWMAAVLACGDGAALGFASAAAHWDLRTGVPTIIDVSVPGAGGRHRRPGLRIHRAATLRADEVTDERHGIPATTPARTILDMAGILSPTRLENLLDRAERQELTDYVALDAIARARPGHRGASALRTALATHYAGADMTRSELEIAFLDLCRASGLPRPDVNATVEGLEVDFLFAAWRLTVETDSWSFHKTRRDFENDRARDAHLAAAGYRTLRFTDRQIARRPETVAAAIRAAAESARGRPGGAP
jgi:predicted transcriptional regulator of viral defense system